ncbi:MAG TPA: hypothetical protein VJU78_08550, partial [Chitinophagaceae bacterium]|nr:hypothetical protein [Chitinophagaceae bacterium]
MAISILLLIVIAAAGGVIYWKIYRKQIIRNELENAVSRKSQGLYTIHYENLKLDEAAGNLAIANMKLSYDSTVYTSLLEKDDAPPTLLKISIPSLIVTGVKTPRALLSKEIVGKKLHIINPVIDIYYTHAGKDSARNIPTTEVYEQVLGELDMIKIDTLEISGAQITTNNIKNGRKHTQINNVSMVLVDIALDEKTGKGQDQLLFANQLFLTCEKISFPSNDQPYNYVVDSLSVNSTTDFAYAKKFRVEPTLKENAFVKSLPAQDDRFDFSLNNIRIQNLNVKQLFNENIIADSLLIGSASFKIYRDLSIPRDKKNRVGRYPHQLLDKIPVSITVKKLILSNAFVEYKEKNKITKQSGKVQFHKVYATITNLTNNKDAVKANNIMTADISTKFLNKASLKVVWQFYLQNPRGRFDIKGNMGSIAAIHTNPLTEPMGPARMEDGQINSLQFNFEGNNYGTNGTVKMLYNDLKLSLLEKDENSKKLDKKAVASFVANMVVKNHNPKEKDDPRIIQVKFDR